VDDDLATLRSARAPVPLLVDEGGLLARRLEARSTPTVVVLDREGVVRFRGWIDNERAPGEPGREAWLDEALTDLVAGQDIRRPVTPTWGCSITRSLGESRRCHPVE